MVELPRRIVARKRGNALGFWFFKMFLRAGGLPAAYALLNGVALHYLLFDRQAKANALAYLRRRFPGEGFFAYRRHVYRLFISQGRQLIDRYAHLHGLAGYDFSTTGMEQLAGLGKDSGKGFILLVSHVGNWQIGLSVLRELKRQVYLVMRPEDNPAVASTLKLDREQDCIKVISPEGYLGGAVEIVKALNSGAIVSMMGDRSYDFNAVPAGFLGDEAALPMGPYLIAAAADVPVVVLLTAKTGQQRYEIDLMHVMRPAYVKGQDKKGTLAGFARQFARIVEEYVAKYPYQCFLFHDIWQKGATHGNEGTGTRRITPEA